MKENETMEQQTQQADEAAKGLQDALMRAALDGQRNDAPVATVDEKNSEKTPAAIGAGAAGPGRPKGVRNKLTNLRDAVLEAFDTVGGPEYLVRLANGTQSDRAAFVSVINKVLPSQINANVEGGIQVQLSWLAGRSIGTTQAQVVEERTQVIDLERDSGGKYRIKDPIDAPAGGDAGGKGQEGAKDA